jgi:hypothetical protein
VISVFVCNDVTKVFFLKSNVRYSELQVLYYFKAFMLFQETRTHITLSKDVDSVAICVVG